MQCPWKIPAEGGRGWRSQPANGAVWKGCLIPKGDMSDQRTDGLEVAGIRHRDILPDVREAQKEDIALLWSDANL